MDREKGEEEEVRKEGRAKLIKVNQMKAKLKRKMVCGGFLLTLFCIIHPRPKLFLQNRGI